MSVMNEYKREFELRKNGVTDMCEYKESLTSLEGLYFEGAIGTPHHGNASKMTLEEFPQYFWKSLKSRKV